MDEFTFLVRWNIFASIQSTWGVRRVRFFNPKICIKTLNSRETNLWLRYSFRNLTYFPILCDMHLHSEKCFYTCISKFSNPTVVNGASACNCKYLRDKVCQVHHPLETHWSLCWTCQHLFLLAIFLALTILWFYLFFTEILWV